MKLLFTQGIINYSPRTKHPQHKTAGGINLAPSFPLQNNKSRAANINETVMPDNTDAYNCDAMRELMHELRNPLTAIKIATEMLEQEHKKDPPALRDNKTVYTRIINRNVIKLEGMVRRLACKQMEKENSMQVTNLTHVLDAALQEAEDRIFLNSIEVQKNYSAGCIIQGNPRKLQLVFLNVIVNAIEAIKTRKGKIWVNIFPSGNLVKVVIRDNGSGMYPETTSRIFEPQFTSKSDGIGMGLANVKTILDGHAAHVSVDSQPGIGTSFVITFTAY